VRLSHTVAGAISGLRDGRPQNAAAVLCASSMLMSVTVVLTKLVFRCLYKPATDTTCNHQGSSTGVVDHCHLTETMQPRKALAIVQSSARS
jgi:hypothetical protein